MTVRRFLSVLLMMYVVSLLLCGLGRGLFGAYNPYSQSEYTLPVRESDDENIISAASDVPTGERVNINTASADELDALYGIGEEYAARIIAHRRFYGDFLLPEDLMSVSGIGYKKFNAIKSSITTN